MNKYTVFYETLYQAYTGTTFSVANVALIEAKSVEDINREIEKLSEGEADVNIIYVVAGHHETLLPDGVCDE